MKTKIRFIIMSAILLSCGKEIKEQPASNSLRTPITETWQLVSAILVEKGNTTTTDYTKNTSFIKIINDTHFAFSQYDLNKGKDSAVFSSGGSIYSLQDSLYTEHLEYCSAYPINKGVNFSSCHFISLEV